jgi:hypothetical protein
VILSTKDIEAMKRIADLPEMGVRELDLEPGAGRGTVTSSASSRACS